MNTPILPMPEWRLHIGNQTTGLTLRPDAQYPTMWRIHAPNGYVSDMVNLTRAKDAAITWARPKGLGRHEVVRWSRRQTVPASSQAA